MLCLAAVLPLVQPSALALDPRLRVTQYLHNSWTQEQGTELPPVHSMAQTAEGYLWLGTKEGLYRFDGIRLTPWDRISQEKLLGSIGRLAATENDGLWIASGSGISRFEGGTLHSYPDTNAWLINKVVSMAKDQSGRLWMTGASPAPGVARLSPDGAFQTYSTSDGLPAGRIYTLAFDKRNRLWVRTSQAICQWEPGTEAVCTANPDLEMLSKSGNGSHLFAWDSRARKILRFPAGPSEPETLLTADAAATYRVGIEDRDGSVWIGTMDKGLARLSNGKLESFTRRDGLSGDVVSSIVEDREGNIWVGTGRGLDRFRNPKVRHLTTLDGLSSDLITTIYPAEDGAVWVGTGAGLNRVSDGKVSPVPAEAGFPSTMLTSLFVEPGGRLLTGTVGGFGYLLNQRFRPILAADGSTLKMVQTMTRVRDGDTWVVDQNAGLFAVRGGVARRPEIDGLPSKRIFQIFTDRGGAVWLGYFEGGLSIVNGKAVRNYGSEDGLAEGSVQAIAQDQSGAVWVGTRHGLSRFQDSQWTTWGAEHGIPEEGVRCILEDNRRDLWIVTAKGITRLPSTELKDSRPGTAAKLNLNLYGQSYGLRLGVRANMANPRGGKAADGTLWIATEDGVAIVDPERVQDNHVQPPVVIEEMAVDGNQVDVHTESPVGFRGKQVRITYSGLSLVAPERVRFRYKLEGLDPNWTEAGTVRTAVFGNLAPGPYRFVVTACNNDEVWNEAGAVLSFRVEPYFYQTKWFLALCVCLAALTAWAAHQMRMRRLATHYRLVAQERSRLTRELHDSLLQGFAAVIYKLEAASKLFDTNPDSSRRRLDQALDQAEHSLVEARLTIQSMRLPELENSTLPEALTAIAKRLTESTSVVFDLHVMGRVQQLPYDAQAGAYFICREAITNSINHAGAKRIRAKLTYAAKELRLIVQDDGCGFDPDAAIPKPGHVGLAGMRERAVKMGASFRIDSSPGQGSVVELIIPRK